MSDLEKIPLAIAYTKGASDKNTGSELTNIMVHLEDQGGKSNHILKNTEGYIHMEDIEDTIYGLYNWNNYLYVVTQTGFYRTEPLDTLDVPTLFNDLIKIADVDISDKVTFANNGVDISFVAGNGYHYNPETGIFDDYMQQDGWYPADTVAYMDGYFIFNRSGTGQFFITEVYSTTLNPLDWATGESAPDDTVAVWVASRQLWIMGESSCEVWYDSGDPLFPFTRISGAVSDIGLLNYRTVARIQENIFFVGHDLRVYMTQGYTPTVVSTPAVEKELRGYNGMFINGFTYHINGKWRYVLQISDSMTLVYSMDSKQWHRMSSANIARWAIRGAVNVLFNGEVVGYDTKSFHRLSMEIHTENGTPIKKTITSLPLNKGVNRFILREVQLDMEVGYGEPGDNNEWFIETSNDGSRTWSNGMPASHQGNWGETLRKVKWRRLGQFRDCALKFTSFTERPVRIIGLNVGTN